MDKAFVQSELVVNACHSFEITPKHFDSDRFKLYPVFIQRESWSNYWTEYLYTSNILDHNLWFRFSKKGKVEIFSTQSDDEVFVFINELKKYKIINIHPILCGSISASFEIKIENVLEFFNWIISSHNDDGMKLKIYCDFLHILNADNKECTSIRINNDKLCFNSVSHSELNRAYIFIKRRIMEYQNGT